MTFIKDEKEKVIVRLTEFINELKSEKYSDAEFYEKWDTLKQTFTEDQLKWRKQEEDRQLLSTCTICHVNFGKYHVLEKYQGERICDNCLKTKLVCPKCKTGKLVFIETEEKYCSVHHFHYATHRIFQCNNPECNNIEINEIRHGWCD